MKPLSGERYAVGLFNLGAEETTLEVHWSDLGLDGALEVRDVWAGEDRGTFAERFSATVPAHGVALLVVRPAAPVVGVEDPTHERNATQAANRD